MDARGEAGALRKQVIGAIKMHLLYCAVTVVFLFLGYEAQEPAFYFIAGVCALPVLSTLIEFVQTTIGIISALRQAMIQAGAGCAFCFVAKGVAIWA